jgi:RimJ/RimL family protein N-acetyltransferase
MDTRNLTTPRLKLKPIFELSPQILYDAVQESLPQLQHYLFWVQNGYTMADAENFMTMTRENWESGKVYAYAFYTDGCPFIGSIDIRNKSSSMVPHVVTYSMGWWCRSSQTGRGYTTEAAQAVMNEAFRTHNATRVSADADSNNLASQKVMKNIGMQYIGAERMGHWYFGGNRFSDNTLHDITRPEWEQQQIKRA